MSDYVCTSSNAVEVIKCIPKEKKILFVPDKNLGQYLIKESGRAMRLWDGSCLVHEAFSLEKLIQLKISHQEALIIAHPESTTSILKYAHFVGSTAKMIRFVEAHAAKSFIVATEAGILYEMQKRVPNKRLIPAPINEDNSCACSECAFMKVNTLEKVYHCLKDENPEIILNENVRVAAEKPLLKMLTVS